jgi:hypothetical protein
VVYVPASPGPFRVPFQRVTAEAIDSGALRTRGCVGLTPKVLVSVSIYTSYMLSKWSLTL